MTKRDKRKYTVKIIENGDISNLRIIAETVARQIKNGGMQI